MLRENAVVPNCKKANCGPTVLIVPPFAEIGRPSLGLHILQASARAVGFEAEVVYGNIRFAKLVGERIYSWICNAPRAWMVGERLFAGPAHGLPRLGLDGHALERAITAAIAQKGDAYVPTMDQLYDCAARAAEFCSDLAEFVVSLCPRVVGCSSMFEQTNASLAILSSIKRRIPHVVSIIGGANCEGEMADAISSLANCPDYVFSGECETQFPHFLSQLADGAPPRERVIRGSGIVDLDEVPDPDYTAFFTQLSEHFPSYAGDIWLSYETSRGCWWGAKHHCTFCGLNGETMRFREKSPDKVIQTLSRLLATSPTRLVEMTDNIMPHSYFRSLVPRLAAELPAVTIFYEQKANLTLNAVRSLHAAGITCIQPGIEALSSRLLRRMNKGVLARQNLALLRYARSLGMRVYWNLLCDFPGDEVEAYQETLAVLPLLRHLMPPSGLSPLSIDRFSPYFERPTTFGIEKTEPLPAYYSVFPPGTDIDRIAYHFSGAYSSAAREYPDLLDAIRDEARRWKEAWTATSTPTPVLTVTPLNDDTFLLIDTRGLPGAGEFQFISQDQARLALSGGPLAKVGVIDWALDAQVCVVMDGWCVPLAVASSDVLEQFEVAGHYMTYDVAQAHAYATPTPGG